MTLLSLFSFIKINFFSFKNQKIADFNNDIQIFDIRKILNGNMVAEGMIYGVSGQLSSTFTARFNWALDGNLGSFTEEFNFSTCK